MAERFTSAAMNRLNTTSISIYFNDLYDWFETCCVGLRLIPLYRYQSPDSRHRRSAYATPHTSSENRMKRTQVFAALAMIASLAFCAGASATVLAFVSQAG